MQRLLGALTLVLLTLVLMAGCTQASEVTVESPGEVGAYRWREEILVPVRAYIVNSGDTPVYLDPCETVEKWVNDQWVPGYQTLCLLGVPDIRLDPGMEHHFKRDLLERMANAEPQFPHGIPGRYRVTLGIARDADGVTPGAQLPVESRRFEFEVIE